jgi:hypothetical protein
VDVEAFLDEDETIMIPCLCGEWVRRKSRTEVRIGDKFSYIHNTRAGKRARAGQCVGSYDVTVSSVPFRSEWRRGYYSDTSTTQRGLLFSAKYAAWARNRALALTW